MSADFVLAHFSDHADAEKISSLIAALLVVFLVLFACRLRAWLERASADALA